MKRNKQCFFDIETEKRICEDYQAGEGGATYLMKKYGANSVQTIYGILKAYNIPRRSLADARRITLKYTLDENCFSTCSTPKACYWLGVMYTDGYISKASQYTNYFGLSVQEGDKEWIEKFKEFLHYSGEIHHYNVGSTGYKPGSPYVRLLIGNSKIVQDLEHFGVVEHKTTKINKLPEIPYLDDFIRGVVDGDGSLRKAAPDLRICGNYDFLVAIGEYLGYPYKLYPDKTIYDLAYNREYSRILEKRLYENASVFLDRKYQIAKRSF